MDKGIKIVYLCKIAEIDMSIEKKWIVMEPGNPALVLNSTEWVLILWPIYWSRISTLLPRQGNFPSRPFKAS